MFDAAFPAVQPLSAEGPLFTADRAIRARLTEVFPPTRFVHATLNTAVTREEWTRVVRRTPFIGLTWLGAAPDSTSGRLLRMRATWRLLLVVGNGDPAMRLTGDRFSPGLYAMVQVAAAALHGMPIGGDDLRGAGTLEVTEAVALASEGWADEAEAIAGITLASAFTLLGTPGSLDDLLRMRGSWAFTLPESEPIEGGGFDLHIPPASVLGEFILDQSQMV